MIRIIIAVVAVPLVVIAFMAMRRNTAASELPASTDANEKSANGAGVRGR